MSSYEPAAGPVFMDFWHQPLRWRRISTGDLYLEVGEALAIRLTDEQAAALREMPIPPRRDDERGSRSAR